MLTANQNGMIHQASFRWTRVISLYSFITICLVLVAFESFTILKGHWLGDFWEHSAVVKELSENLFHPSNPIIKTNAPHAFFSPYAVLVAAIARLTSTNSIDALQYAAFFNLFFFLFCFHKFCKVILVGKDNIIASFSLLLVLFFWGRDPLGWSGFYHFISLHYVLPYPSTFAMALSLLTLSVLGAEQNAKYFTLNSVAVILMIAIVLLTHPNTGILLLTAIVGMNFSFSNYSWKYAIIKSLVLIIPAFSLSLLWPYFSVVQLLFGNNSDFQIASKRLYQGVFRMYWPCLLVLPGFFFARRDKIFYFFFSTLGLMTAIYVVGYITKIYGVGRIIAGIMMFAHFLMAYMIVQCVANKRRISSILYLILLGGAFCTSLFLNKKFINTAFNTPRGHEYINYGFLRTLVKSNDIVLSDRGSNSGIPSFSGKVVSWDKPLYWVADLDERRSAVQAFFSVSTSDSIRKVILEKYKPDFVLFDYSRLDLNPQTVQWIESLGKVIYKKNQQELIELD
jgi:hypothetical protein